MMSQSIPVCYSSQTHQLCNPMGVLGRYDHAQDDGVRPRASLWRYDASTSSHSSVAQSDDSSQYLDMAKTSGKFEFSCHWVKIIWSKFKLHPVLFKAKVRVRVFRWIGIYTAQNISSGFEAHSSAITPWFWWFRWPVCIRFKWSWSEALERALEDPALRMQLLHALQTVVWYLSHVLGVAQASSRRSFVVASVWRWSKKHMENWRAPLFVT